MTVEKHKNGNPKNTELIVSVLLLLFLLLILGALFIVKPAEFDLKVIVLQALRYYLKQLIIASRIVGQASTIMVIGLALLATSALSGVYFLLGVFQAGRRPDAAKEEEEGNGQRTEG